MINVFTRDARGNLIRSIQHGFHLFNTRGDVVQRVNSQGVVLHTYRYDAFGNELNVDEGDAGTEPPCTDPRVEITATQYVVPFCCRFKALYGQLTAVVYPPDTNQNVTWSSSNPGLLNVESGGQFWTKWLLVCCCIIIACCFGLALVCWCCTPNFTITITATAENGTTGTFEIVITQEMFSNLSRQSNCTNDSDDTDSAENCDCEIPPWNPFEHPELLAVREIIPAAQHNAMTSDFDSSFIQEYTLDLDGTAFTQNTTPQDAFVFGVEENPLPVNTNPFRFASMYWDNHTQTYMTPNRMLNPRTGRWTQPDPYWGLHNMIFGDDPRRINEREDPLGLNTYTMVPDIWAIMQSGNLYMYTMHNPVFFKDSSGLFATPASIIGALIGAGLGVLIGTAIANHFELTGWARTAAIGGTTLLATVAGWFAGPAVLSAITPVVEQAIARGTLVVTNAKQWIVEALNIRVTPVLGRKLDYVFGKATGLHIISREANKCSIKLIE